MLQPTVENLAGPNIQLAKPMGAKDVSHDARKEGKAWQGSDKG